MVAGMDFDDTPVAEEPALPAGLAIRNSVTHVTHENKRTPLGNTSPPTGAMRERPEAEEPPSYTVAAQVLQSPDGGGAPPKARPLSTHRREKRIQARAAKRDKRAALAAQHDDEVGIAMGDINPLRDAKNRVVHGL